MRRSAIRGAALGAVCTGTYGLAKAGLLDGDRATIHWENQASLASEHDGPVIGSDLFEIDRNRFTCAGGTAADMMLSLTVRDHGPGIATSNEMSRRPTPPPQAAAMTDEAPPEPPLTLALRARRTSR